MGNCVALRRAMNRRTTNRSVCYHTSASTFSLRLRKHNLEDYATMATCVIAQSGRLCYDGNFRYPTVFMLTGDSVLHIISFMLLGALEARIVIWIDL